MAIRHARKVSLAENRCGESWLCKYHHARRGLDEVRAGP